MVCRENISFRGLWVDSGMYAVENLASEVCEISVHIM